jgi:hypothetical protein
MIDSGAALSVNLGNAARFRGVCLPHVAVDHRMHGLLSFTATVEDGCGTLRG